MSNMHWFILAVLVMAALAFWQWQRSQDQLALLQQSGFQISEDLGGQPRLLLDSGAGELALVAPDGYTRIAFSEVVTADYRYDSGTQVDGNFRIELGSRPGRVLAVQYESEWQAQERLQQLKKLLGR